MNAPTRHTLKALDHDHQQIQAHLAKLDALLAQLREEDDGMAVRQSAGEIEAFFSGTSRQHHLEEEAEVFPVLLQSEDAALVQAVQTLRQDHNWLELNWSELAPMLRALEQGEDWVDLEHLQHAIEVFGKLSEDHIEREESLIYPKARQLQSQEALGSS